MKYFPLLFVLFFAVQSRGQNLVINGDFEDFTTCPTTLSQTTNCIGWRSFTTGGSSDYFNCTLTPTQTYFGYQQPASGTAYMGGYAFTGNNQTTNTYKEYVAGTMVPMQVGITYEVSVSVNLANVSGYGTDDLGIFLYDNGPASYTTTSVPPVTPQISFSSYGPIGDTVNWVRLVANFYADSAYDNIVIGSWQQSAVSNQITVPPGNVSYYYFDSIVVKIASKLSINYSDSLLCAGQTITVPYTVNSPGYFLSGNTFSLQLSDATGSFALATVLATQAGTTSGSFTVVVPNVTPGAGYRIRVVSSNPVEVSNISTKPISIGNTIPVKPVITATNPCEGQVLNLNAATTTPGVTYKWKGPNTFTSTLQNPTISSVTAAANGDYIVTTWLYGCSAADTETVSINPQPTSITAGSNSPVCEKETLNLTSTNSTTGATYSWTGPNSFTSNMQNPTINNISAAGSGIYTVTANLNGCTASNTTAVVVKPLPANFSAGSNSPVCSTKPLNLLGNTTSTGVTFSWTGPGAFNSSSQNPTITNSIPANTGDYILTATLNGCSIKDTETVVVNQSPAGSVTAQANSPLCQNTSLNLTATNAAVGSIYSWTGPNSFTSSDQNPTINTIPLAGSGSYQVSVSLNGCTEQNTVNVTVKPAPENVNATANTPICEGQTLNLNVTNTTAGVNYTWAGPNSFTANTQSPSLTNTTLTAAGDYISTLSINGCVIKDTVNVIINPVPTTPTASSNTPVCNGKTLNLYSGGSLAGATYNWTGPNSFTSSQQNPVINPVNTSIGGIYTVTASLNGCTSPANTTSVTVLYFPSSIAVYVLPNDTICVGGSIQLIGVASNGGAIPQFKWLKNGFPISGANSVSYATSLVTDKDKFSVVLTPDNSCPDPDTSTPMEITVLPYLTPSVSITANPGTLISPWQTVTFTATPINGGKNPTYQWKRNGQDIIGAVNDTWGAYTLSNNDTISVVLYSDEFCPSPTTATSNKIIITVKLGVDELTDNGNGFTLYPNPNNGNFTLKGNIGTNEPVTAEVWNSIGQLVYSNTLQPQNNILNTEIALSKNLASGVYILKLKAGTGTKLMRFTIGK